MLKLFYKISDRVFAFTENPRVPLSYYLLTLFAVISLRNFLDIFSDTATAPFKLFSIHSALYLPSNAGIIISLSHFYLFWFSILLTFALIYAGITKEEAGKPLRTICAFSGIILFTPLIDLIISSGKGIEQSFIFPKNISELLPLPPALNPGEKITIITSLLLTFAYCLGKTHKLNKTLLAVLLGYAFNLTTLIPSFIITQTVKLFSGDTEALSVMVAVRVWIIYLFFVLSGLLYFKNRAYFKTLLKETGGPPEALSIVLIFILGGMLFRPDFLNFILANGACFLLTVICAILARLFLKMLKNIAGPYEKPAPQDMPLNTYKAIAGGLLVFASICAIAVSAATLFFLLLATAVGAIYHLPPLKLKQIPFISKACLSFMLLLLFILGWLFAGGEILKFPQVFSLYFLTFIALGLNIADMDRLYVFGKERAKSIMGFLFLASYLVLPWLLLEKALLIPSLIAGTTQFFLVRRDIKLRLVFWVYLITLAGLIIYLTF